MTCHLSYFNAYSYAVNLNMRQALMDVVQYLSIRHLRNILVPEPLNYRFDTLSVVRLNQ